MGVPAGTAASVPERLRRKERLSMTLKVTVLLKRSLSLIQKLPKLILLSMLKLTVFQKLSLLILSQVLRTSHIQDQSKFILLTQKLLKDTILSTINNDIIHERIGRFVTF